MYLTTENALEYVGHTIDAKKRILGLYPYRVGLWPNGEPYAMNRAGVCVKVVEPKNRFYGIYFDIVDGEDADEWNRRAKNE